MLLALGGLLGKFCALLLALIVAYHRCAEPL